MDSRGVDVFECLHRFRGGGIVLGFARQFRVWLGLGVAAVTAAGGVLVTAAPASAAPVLFTIKNRLTGKCLAINTSNVISVQSCNGGVFQLWYTELDGATYAIRSYQRSVCVGHNAVTGAVTSSACSSATAQWYSIVSGDWDLIRSSVTSRYLAATTSGAATTVTTSGAAAQWDWIIQ
ncbi:ricin-type beta-trefoil lectin domain protein [Phytohabitans sp. LJ34]|uniref:ricin-type beta-trefoil lectin domain protein n=1 Tax=Phytohabitans sp. LJ34 TaxID=3452217 RepID=UPI003F8C7CA4